MASKNTRLAIAAGLIVVAGMATWYAASPWISVHLMRQAAKAGDHRALSDYIDFPALRESIRGQLATMMNAKMDRPEVRDNPFAAMGQMLMTGMMNQMVDTMVSPQSLANAMTTGAFKPREPGAKLSTEDEERFRSMSTSGYESLDRFVVTVKRESDKIEFVLRRRGLFSWQLTDIGLPFHVPGESAPRSAPSSASTQPNYVDTAATELHKAISRGETDAATDIIYVKQIDPNAQDGDGNTALHLAAMAGNLRVVQALVYAEVRQDIKNKKGERAADVAQSIVAHLVKK